MPEQERCMSYGRGGAGNLRKPTDVAQAKQTLAAMGITEEIDTTIPSSPTTTSSTSDSNPIPIPRPSHDTDFYIHLRRHQPRSRASSRASQSNKTDASESVKNESLSRSGSISSSLGRGVRGLWDGIQGRVRSGRE